MAIHYQSLALSTHTRVYVYTRCTVMAIHYQPLALSTHARVYVYTRCTVMAIHYQPFTTNHYQSLSLTSTHYQSLALTSTHYQSLALSTNHYQSLALTSTHYQSLLTLVCMSNTGSQLGQSELEPNGTAERALLFASALTSLGSMGAEWRY